MPRMLGALGLLGVIFSGCFKQSGYINLNDDVVAKSLPLGATIEDCLDLDAGDTADTGLDGSEAWCPDEDGDSYFGVSASAPFDSGCVCLVAGALPSEYVQVFVTSDVLEDCDDANGDINPGAAEVADDGIDQNCDGSDLESDPDVDGDGFPASTDCDDSDASVNPDAFEICDDVDNDCDSDIDDADDDLEGGTVWYEDGDGDGYGNPDSSVIACELPESGYVDNDGDCDDTNGEINPGALEVCDGIDNDCDSLTDDADDDVIGLTGSESWPDADGDGYGDMDAESTWSCVVPSGNVEDGTDCDDADDGINPGAAEVADDDIDQDCDGTDLVTSSGDDVDGDGFDSIDAGGTDCDDTDAAVNPDATEVSLDGVDNNCDGLANSSDTIEVCVTPEDVLSTFAWQLWLRDSTVDPDGSLTPTWDFPGATDGTGELCASTTVIDGHFQLINGPFDIDGDGIFGEEAVDGDGVWVYMLDGGHASTVTGNGYDLPIVDAPWGFGNDGEWDIDLL